MTTHELSRRTFLARIGVLGAGAVLLPQCAPPGAIGAASSPLSLGAVVELLRPILGQLSRDTWNGFVAFSLPGQDPYARAQGTPRNEPGGVEAQGTDFFIENLDRFLPLPDELVRPATTALVTALRDLPLPLPASALGLLGGLFGPPLVTLGLVDDAVRFILQNDATMPLSLPVAFLLNYVATAVNPLSLQGAGLSPFSRSTRRSRSRSRPPCRGCSSSWVARSTSSPRSAASARAAGTTRKRAASPGGRSAGSSPATCRITSPATAGTT
jgi:hypothetical protein